MVDKPPAVEVGAWAIRAENASVRRSAVAVGDVTHVCVYRTSRIKLDVLVAVLHIAQEPTYCLPNASGD